MPVIFWIAVLWLGEGPHFKALPPPFRIQNSNSLPPLQLGCIQMISILPGRPAAADFDWNEAFCYCLLPNFCGFWSRDRVPPWSELESLSLILCSALNTLLTCCTCVAKLYLAIILGIWSHPQFFESLSLSVCTSLSGGAHSPVAS